LLAGAPYSLSFFNCMMDLQFLTPTDALTAAFFHDDNDAAISTAMSRRTCQYRQKPRSSSINSQAEFDDGSSRTRTPSIASPPSVATTKKKPKLVVVSSSFIRAGNQQAATATTFAAAVSPTSASASAAQTKKLFNRTNLMSSAPLLGAQRHPTKMKKALPLSGSSTPRKLLSHIGKKGNKRRSISKTIKAPLKNMSSKLMKLGKKSSKSKQRLSVVESRDTMDISFNQAANDARDFISLEPKKPLDTDMRLTPLEFDETESINHFRSEDFSPLSQEGHFSLHRVLSPTGSVDSEEGYNNFLKEVDASRSAFEACKAPPPVLFLEDQEDCISRGDASLYRSDSNHSIPSLSGSLGVSTGDDIIACAQVPQDVTNKDEAADSVLAWGCFTALLGAPAPQSVLQEKKKKRTPVNLWQGDEATAEDLDDILSLSQDEDDDASAQESQALSQEDENRRKFNQVLKETMSRRNEGKTSTLETFYKSYISHSDKHESSTDAADPAPKQPVELQEDSGNGHSSLHRSDSSHSIPSICSGIDENAEVVVCDQRSSFDGDIIAMQFVQEATNVEEAADSALVWGCLTALMGSPAPKSVLLGEKKRKRIMPVNLWQDDDEVLVEDLDDIISLPHDYDVDASDDCSIPSMSPEEAQLDEDLVPDMDDSNDLAFHTAAHVTQKSSGKDIADSTLAWSALTALLGSPAPSFAVRKSARKERVNLWEDCEETDLLPEIDELCDDDESDGLSLLSIDLSELADDVCLNNFLDGKDGDKEAANSALAWGALGMILGAPAPKLVSKKNRNASRVVARNLWEDGEAMENDGLDTIPSIHLDEDGIDGIPSPLSEEHQDEHIIPDVEELTLANAFHVTDKREVADSAMAWSALAALLGSPAPSSIVGKKIKRNKGSVVNLWDDGNATEEDLDDLLSFTQDDNEENTQQVYHGDQLITQKGFGQDASDDDDDTQPSLSGTVDDDDVSSSSPLTLGGFYDDLIPSPTRCC